MLKEEYRKKCYREYITRIQEDSARPSNRAEIERRFPIWDAYYGKLIPADPGARILDIGCGRGDFVYYLRRKGYRRVAGIDISPQQVEAARNLKIPDIHAGDFREYLAGKKEAYDLFFLRDVIEHFTREEILDVFGLLRRSLRGGGGCVIKTLNAESPFWPRYRFGDLTHESSFTRTSLRSALLLADFRRISSYPVFPVKRYSLSSRIRYYLYRIMEAVWRAALLIESGDNRGIFTGNFITAAFK